jgi:hypothetical protein
MIENNPCLTRSRSVFGTRDYGPDDDVGDARMPRLPKPRGVQIPQSKFLVDNFVGKLLAARATTRIETACGALHKS